MYINIHTHTYIHTYTYICVVNSIQSPIALCLVLSPRQQDLGGKLAETLHGEGLKLESDRQAGWNTMFFAIFNRDFTYD